MMADKNLSTENKRLQRRFDLDCWVSACYFILVALSRWSLQWFLRKRSAQFLLVLERIRVNSCEFARTVGTSYWCCFELNTSTMLSNICIQYLKFILRETANNPLLITNLCGSTTELLYFCKSATVKIRSVRYPVTNHTLQKDLLA
jgi:hypothetical protein